MNPGVSNVATAGNIQRGVPGRGVAVVIGEVPQSGNYYLYVTKGDNQGKVFQFEHDGFEFIEMGNDLKYIQQTMGHSKIEITLNIYGHLLKGREESHKSAAEDLASELFGKT